MSALTILIVVVVVVPYTLELQLDSTFNDVITLLNHPERLIEAKNEIKNNQKENAAIKTSTNLKKIIDRLIKKASKILQRDNKNRLNYYDQIQGIADNSQLLKLYNDDREANNIEVLNQYLSVKPPWLKPLPMKRKPNYQLDRGHDGNNLYKDVRNNDLTDYSKIYLVLNPEANLEKSDVREISNLVSSMFLKINTNPKSAMKDHPERLYKGFVLRDNRRRIRESNEVFGPKESKEHDYKPKRVRGEHTGARGRTGIPYVRHRGDVYERE